MDRHALKIDFFFPPQDTTQELSLHTQALADALTRRGALVRILKPQRLDFKSFYHDIKEYKPNFTLSFNGVLPSDQGLFLCEILQIPHIAILSDYPLYFVQLLQSDLNCLFAQDKASVRFLKGTGAKEAHFLPMAIDKKVVPPLEKKAEFPLFCWLSSVSSTSIEEKWKNQYPKEIIETLKKAKDFALFDPKMDLSEALSYSLQANSNAHQVKLEELEPLVLLLELEKYLASAGAEQLLAALEGLPLTILAQKGIPSDLPKRFPQFTHIPEGDVNEYLHCLGKSEMALIPEFILKESLPFKLLAALAMDVLPIAPKTDFLSEHFSDQEILYFSKTSLPTLKEKVGATLHNFESFEPQLHKNREKAQNLFSWDVRAEELLSILAAKMA